MTDKTPLELGKRERQLIETVQRLREASVAEVRAHVADPPSYSAVRTMLGLLVDKGWLKVRRDGKRYLYRPRVTMEQCVRQESRSFLDRVFDGAAAPMLNHFVRNSRLSTREIADLKRMLDDLHENQSKGK